MKLFRPVLATAYLAAAFILHAAEPVTTPGRQVAPPMAAELRPLQGTWEGTAVGERSSGEKIRITITVVQPDGNRFKTLAKNVVIR
jgi:hypothetical protein